MKKIITMNKIITLIMSIAILTAAAGCSAYGGTQGKKADIRGQITKVVTDDNKNVTAIFVEGEKDSDTYHDKASIRIDKSTKVYKGDKSEKAAANDLKEGMKAEVVFDGPVAESYPVQAKAKTVRIIE